MSDRWRARFRAARVSLPAWARDAPDRCVYVSNVSGTSEVYAWDRACAESRQVTSRRNGTSTATIDPAGEWIWWFDDTDGNEFGVWRRQRFEGGPDEEAVPGLEPSYPAGLALGRSGVAVVGRSVAAGSSVHVGWPGTDRVPETIYQHEQDAELVDLSRDEALVAVSHSEHGDTVHPALRVLRLDGALVGDLWDGPGLGLRGIGFSPVTGDSRLLARHERGGRPMPLLWDAVAGVDTEVPLALPGEVDAGWRADGRGLVLRHVARARAELLEWPLPDGPLATLGAPAGVVGAASARPDGTVEFSWSSAAEPPQILSTSGAVVLTPPGEPAPPSVPLEDVFVDGPGGLVHALVARPEGVAPYPTVFLVHGGPAHHDADEFHPQTAAWVDHGFAVVRVNYRGSTGYGVGWRDALIGRVGLTELEDIAAVRDWAVSSGLADQARVVLAGGSWGGYLTLLGLGRQPALWSLGIAAVPVADYVAAYEDEMESLQAFDRALFGGAPTEVPGRYAVSSPLTYVDRVRVPVLVLAGANDPRCPIRQIDNYLAALSERGAPHEVYRFEAGHGSLVVEERIRQCGAMIDFARRHLGR